MASLKGLILAKGQSKRLPEKNRKDFNGLPMFVINLEKCLKIFDEVYVSSDDRDILRIAVEAGAKPIYRGAELCGDTPDIPVFQHAFGRMIDASGIVAVHANNPNIEANLIAITKRLLEMGIPEVMTCHPMSQHVAYKMQANHVNGSIRGMSKERLMDYGDPMHPNPEALLVDTSIEIETLEDYEKALWQSTHQ